MGRRGGKEGGAGVGELWPPDHISHTLASVCGGGGGCRSADISAAANLSLPPPGQNVRN